MLGIPRAARPRRRKGRRRRCCPAAAGASGAGARPEGTPWVGCQEPGNQAARGSPEAPRWGRALRSGCTPEGIVLRVEQSCKPQRSERRAAPRRHSPEGDRRIRTGRPRAASRARREAFRACWRGTFRTGRSGGRRGGCVALAGPSACSCPRRSTCRTGRKSLPRKDSRPSLSLSRESQLHTHTFTFTFTFTTTEEESSSSTSL